MYRPLRDKNNAIPDESDEHAQRFGLGVGSEDAALKGTALQKPILKSPRRSAAATQARKRETRSNAERPAPSGKEERARQCRAPCMLTAGGNSLEGLGELRSGREAGCP
jgi:hypothetical protein